MSEKDEVEKMPQVGIKDFEEKDYAGIIAVLAWVGFLAMMCLCIVLKDMDALKTVAAILGGPIGLITGFYFKGKQV